MKNSLKLVTILSIFASCPIVAMDYNQVWEGKTFYEWGKSFVDIENVRASKSPRLLAFLKGQHPSLGEQSPVQIIDQAVMQEILRYVQPAAQDFIYLKENALLWSIKILHHNAQTIGKFKTHLRAMLGMAPSDRLELMHGGLNTNDADPLNPTMGTPNSPYTIIR